MKKKAKPLVCYYGTDWLDHFPKPIGTGVGCLACNVGAKQERLPVGAS